jgi:hypothetical protein
MQNHPRINTSLNLLLLAGIAATSMAAAPAATQATDDSQPMDKIWDDLQKDEPWSSRALLDFADQPAATVAYFKEHLKPLKIEQKDLDRLLTDLGSDDEKVWKPAFEMLEYFDPRLNMDLTTLVNNANEQPARNRLIEVLCDYSPGQLRGKNIQLRAAGADFNFYAPSYGSWWAEHKVSRLTRQKKQWIRAARAIVLLQHIASQDAIAVLKDLATGNPDAEPTVVAKVALESLKTN